MRERAATLGREPNLDSFRTSISWNISDHRVLEVAQNPAHPRERCAGALLRTRTGSRAERSGCCRGVPVGLPNYQERTNGVRQVTRIGVFTQEDNIVGSDVAPTLYGKSGVTLCDLRDLHDRHRNARRPPCSRSGL